MVLGEGYDNSLWLILAGDNIYGQRVVECIKNMPSEVLEQIQLIIKTANNKDKVYVESTKEYYFALRIKNKILYIYLDKCDKKGLVGEEFSLSIIPLSKEELSSMKLYSKKYIGWFMEKTSNMFNCTHNDVCCIDQFNLYTDEYKLFQWPFGTVLKSFCENKYSDYICKYCRVNIKKIPDNMFIHQFKDDKKLNRLVRRKV